MYTTNRSTCTSTSAAASETSQSIARHAQFPGTDHTTIIETSTRVHKTCTNYIHTASTTKHALTQNRQARRHTTYTHTHAYTSAQPITRTYLQAHEGRTYQQTTHLQPHPQARTHDTRTHAHTNIHKHKLTRSDNVHTHPATQARTYASTHSLMQTQRRHTHTQAQIHACRQQDFAACALHACANLLTFTPVMVFESI